MEYIEDAMSESDHFSMARKQAFGKSGCWTAARPSAGYGGLLTQLGH
jgi:hypothetical protein